MSKISIPVFVNNFLFSFKAITFLYVIAFIAYAIVYFLKSNIVLESRIPIFNFLFKNSKFDFQFPVWFYILFWIFNLSLVVTLLYLLVFSFTNINFPFLFLVSKKTAILFYSFLIFFSVFIFFITYTCFEDSFFDHDKLNAIDKVLNFIYPKTASELQMAFYNKIEATILFIIACCNTFFCIYFWKAYKIKIKSTYI